MNQFNLFVERLRGVRRVWLTNTTRGFPHVAWGKNFSSVHLSNYASVLYVKGRTAGLTPLISALVYFNVSGSEVRKMPTRMILDGTCRYFQYRYDCRLNEGFLIFPCSGNDTDRNAQPSTKPDFKQSNDWSFPPYFFRLPPWLPALADRC